MERAQVFRDRDFEVEPGQARAFQIFETSLGRFLQMLLKELWLQKKIRDHFRHSLLVLIRLGLF